MEQNEALQSNTDIDVSYYNREKNKKGIFSFTGLEIPFWLYFAHRIHLYPWKRPIIEIWNIVIDINSILLILISLFYMFHFLFTTKNVNPKWTKRLPIFFLLLILYSFISLGFSDLSDSPNDMTGMTYSLVVLLFSFIFAFCFIASMKIDDLENFIKRFVIVFTLYSLSYTILHVTGLADYVFKLSRGYEKSKSVIGTRVTGPLLFSVSAAFIYLPLIGFTLDKIFSKKTYKLGYLFLLIALFIGFFSSLSRGATIVSTVYIIMIILFIRNIDIKFISLFMKIAIIGVAIYFALSQFEPAQRLFRFESTARTETYKKSYEIFQESSTEKKLLGQGYGGLWPWYNFSLYKNEQPAMIGLKTPLSSSHSDFLLLVFELGIVGLSFYLYLFFVVVRCAIFHTVNKNKFIALALASSLVATFYANFWFTTTTGEALIWWLFLFAVFKLVYTYNLNEVTNNRT